MILSPSLLSADFADVSQELAALAGANIRWLHLDVMDGAFVPNITFGPPVIASFRKRTDLFFDVHLMIEQPLRHIDAFLDAGADLLVVHAEADLHIEKTLSYIKSHGRKAGIAFNPGTDWSQIRWLLDSLDFILLMSVNPGFSGQKFIPATLAKIAACRAFLDESGRGDIPIEVDGGVTPENTGALVSAGAAVLVSGSSFFGHKPYATRHETFLRAASSVQEHQQSSDVCKTWAHGAQEG